MTSTTSFNNWVVFKGALKRLKWFGILYGVALVLELPLLAWMQLSRMKAVQGALWVADKSFQPQMLFHPLAHLTNVAVAVIFGLIIYNYLHNDRANTFFHSLPIKRSVLYCQNLLAGLTLIWVPLLLNGVLLYLVFNIFGVTKGQWNNPQVYGPMGDLVSNGPITVSVWQILGYWLFLSLLMTGLFFIFTAFVGMLTGNVLLQGALTFIGLFLPLGLYLLVKFNLSKLVYGLPRDVNDRTVEWLSPLVSYLDNNNYGFISGQINWYLGYLAAALIILGVSIYLYKLRHAEAAGETLAATWIRWVFKYGVAICAALTGGIYFSSLNENSPGVLYLGYIIGALLGYCISDMIAYKSFHFYKRWKGLGVFGIVFLLLLASVRVDLVGYERHVPVQNEVKEVLLSNLVGDGYGIIEGDANIPGMSTPENIERVRRLHQRIIDREEENKALERSASGGNLGKRGPDFTQKRIVPLGITYVLQNGSKVKRQYNIEINSYRQYLYPIFDTPDAKKSMYHRFYRINADKLDQIIVNNFHLSKNVRIYKRAEINEALAAIRKDLLNTSYEEVVEMKVPPKASIEFNSKVSFNGGYNTYNYNLSYYQEFRNLEAFLKTNGYLDELFLKPEEVSKITLKKVGSSSITEVKDKQKIQLLLDWCRLADEQEFLRRQTQPEYSKGVEYYGKILLQNGKTIVIGFDDNKYAWELINNIVTR